MKNFLLKIALPLSIGLISSHAVLASPLTAAPHSFGKGNDMIHVTTIHTGGDTVFASGILYLGSKSNSDTCQIIKPVGYARGYYRDGFQISAPSELFNGQALDSNSCAIEEFTVVDTGKSSSIDYMLINDGQKVTAADPAKSDLTLPTVKK